MARAIFNGIVIAESAAVEIVEDNVYFPPENIVWTYRSPKSKAENIKNYVAFYPAVTVER